MHSYLSYPNVFYAFLTSLESVERVPVKEGKAEDHFGGDACLINLGGTNESGNRSEEGDGRMSETGLLQFLPIAR